MRSSLQEFSFQVNKALLPQLKLKEVDIDVNSCKLRIKFCGQKIPTGRGEGKEPMASSEYQSLKADSHEGHHFFWHEFMRQ